MCSLPIDQHLLQPHQSTYNSPPTTLTGNIHLLRAQRSRWHTFGLPSDSILSRPGPVRLSALGGQFVADTVPSDTILSLKVFFFSLLLGWLQLYLVRTCTSCNFQTPLIQFLNYKLFHFPHMSGSCASGSIDSPLNFCWVRRCNGWEFYSCWVLEMEKKSARILRPTSQFPSCVLPTALTASTPPKRNWKSRKLCWQLRTRVTLQTCKDERGSGFKAVTSFFSFIVYRKYWVQRL